MLREFTPNEVNAILAAGVLIFGIIKWMTDDDDNDDDTPTGTT